MFTFLIVWSESLLLSDMQGIPMDRDLAENAVTVAASDIPGNQYRQTRIQIQKDGRTILTIHPYVDADMAGSTDNLFDYICSIEKSALELIKRDRDVGASTDIARAARMVIDALL